HLAFLQEIDKSVSAVQSVMDHGARSPAPAASSAPSRKGAKTKLERLLKGRAVKRALSEVDSKVLLNAYGIASPKEAVARSETEAVAVAKRIGFPVVAKAVSAALAHKSDAGGVILGLNSAKEVRQAYRRLAGPVAKRARVTLDGVLIAEHVSGGIE